MEFITYTTVSQEQFESCLKSLASRARRLGIEPLVHEYVGEEMRKHITEDSSYNYRVFHYKVEDRKVQLGGYTLHGSVTDKVNPDGVRVLLSKGFSDMAREYLQANLETRCDHCKTNRRRTESFLLSGSDGKYMLVGSTCVKDFTGHSPKVAEFFAGLGEEIDGNGGGSGFRAATHLDMLAFIKAAHYAINDAGTYLSNDAANEQMRMPTGGHACHLLQLKPRTKEEIAEYDKFMAYQVDAEAILAYIKSMPATTDYARNVLALTESKFIEIARYPLALMASAVWGYVKSMRPKVAREPKAASKHVGLVGDRTVFTLTLTYVHWVETQYGCTGFHKFVDEEGNAFEWATSRSPCDLNEKITLKATVKRHSEYNGRLYTEITRGKVVEA